MQRCKCHISTSIELITSTRSVSTVHTDSESTNKTKKEPVLSGDLPPSFLHCDHDAAAVEMLCVHMLYACTVAAV
jgi:hypothetical protein